jgi:hypothetical protein
VVSEAFLQGLKDFFIGRIFQDSVYHVSGPGLQNSDAVDFSWRGERFQTSAETRPMM